MYVALFPRLAPTWLKTDTEGNLMDEARKNKQINALKHFSEVGLIERKNEMVNIRFQYENLSNMTLNEVQLLS